ncbi:MAG: acyl-CoA dehydrogenase family protein, partial [Betaproteobacteria bacterium]|nr:acyl-CoA dehydrogenase family protein [Betaproteobacteria bacterium]
MILSEEQQMLRDAVRQYTREQIAPNAAAWDRDGTFPQQALKGLAAMGLYGITIAEEWGGAGMDDTALALALEEIAAGDGATST